MRPEQVGLCTNRFMSQHVVCGIVYPTSRREVESNVSTLKDRERRLVIAGVATLAVFASFLLGAVFFAILLGLGINEDLAWGLSVLMWIAVVASGVLGLVYFYDSIKKRVEQVSVLRSVVAPLATPNDPAVEAEPQFNQDQPSIPSAPHTSYRDMLLEGDRKDDQPK